MTAPRENDSPEETRKALSHALQHAAHLLPAQGPIAVFIHHNTLHAFQHLPFFEALERASATLGIQSTLSPEEFRAAYRVGRINDEDLSAALNESELQDAGEIERLSLLHDLEPRPLAELRWELEEAGADRRFGNDIPAEPRKRSTGSTSAWILEQVEAIRGGNPSAETLATLHALRQALNVSSAEALLSALRRSPEETGLRALWAQAQAVPLKALITPRSTGDSNESSGTETLERVNAELVRLAAAFLDEGLAVWPMPRRDEGFLTAWRELVASGTMLLPSWMNALPEEQSGDRRPAEEVILSELRRRNVARSDWEQAIVQTLLRLPGWAGMFHRLESFPDERSPGAPPTRLADFLAVRLILERHATAHERAALEPEPFPEPPREPRGELQTEPSTWVSAWRLFRLAQAHGWGAGELAALNAVERSELLSRIDRLSATQRRRVWQEAYEGHYREEILSALAVNMARPIAARGPGAGTARFQVIFCFDEREESIRRHLEEQDPRYETFGAAGFFGLAMNYQGLDDGTAAAVCPVGVTPAHRIEERPVGGHTQGAKSRASRRRAWTRLARRVRHLSHSPLAGPWIAPLFAPLAMLAASAEALAPNLMGRLRIRAEAAWLPSPTTDLTALRAESAGAGEMLGYTPQEAADRVGTLLENVGLTHNFSPMVAILGHGSSSVNNPHRSAYDCGACGGRHGRASARLFARLANDAGVRERLLARGIAIPQETVFVGGLHNTATDEIELSDLYRVPASSAALLSELRAALDRARADSAKERCRRFASAPRHPNRQEALRHAQSRTHAPGQARPELGHVTNASAVVGRRVLSRGLFLDRRTFLISYDPAIDEEGAIIERIMMAVGPVGGGINLEYYFSRVDNERLGSGTKLPHNITGLLGVMDGAASDLRTGLPRQMIEIHEPMRLLTVVEATPERLSALCAKQPVLMELVGNGWIQVVSLHPTTGQIARFTPGGWQPWQPRKPGALTTVRSSEAWYSGKEGFVPPALIDLEGGLARAG